MWLAEVMASAKVLGYEYVGCGQGPVSDCSGQGGQSDVLEVR